VLFNKWLYEMLTGTRNSHWPNQPLRVNSHGQRLQSFHHFFNLNILQLKLKLLFCHNTSYLLNTCINNMSCSAN